MPLFKKEKPVFEGQIIAETNEEDCYIVRSQDSSEIYICTDTSKRKARPKDVVYFEKKEVNEDSFFKAGVIRTSYDSNDLQFAENKELKDCSKSDVLKKWYNNLPLEEEHFNTRNERNAKIFTSLSRDGAKELHTIMASGGIL